MTLDSLDAQVSGRAAKAAATREAIISHARRAFAEAGYAATSLGHLVPPNMTKGALYHHFPNKKAVFLAVYEQMEEELVARVDAAVRRASECGRAAGDGPIHVGAWECALVALDTFLEVSAEPDYARIMHLESRSVLAEGEDRAINQALGLVLVQQLVDDLVAESQIVDTLPREMLARILHAAVSEVALSMTEAGDVVRTRHEGREVLLALIASLRRPG